MEFQMYCMREEWKEGGSKQGGREREEGSNDGDRGREKSC